MASAPILYWPYPPEQVGTWVGGYLGHQGTDWPKPTGTPVPATSDGVIEFAGDDGLGGQTIDLRRDDGLVQRFGHLSSIWVKVGQRVVAGNTIGLVGSTGNSTGPHLHWELRWDREWNGGDWVDPRTLDPMTFGAVPDDREHEEEEDDMSVVYLRATSNSSPIVAGNPGTSRIWAGDDRVIEGAKYSGVWERADSAAVPRRLFPGEWQAIQDAYAAAGRKVPYASISGNELEKMYLVKRAAPQPVKK